MTEDWTTDPADADRVPDVRPVDVSADEPVMVDTPETSAAETRRGDLPAGAAAQNPEAQDPETPDPETPDRETAEVWSTGDPRVDDAVARLADLDERDLDEHADVYDTIHGDLSDVLDDAARPSSQQ